MGTNASYFRPATIQETKTQDNAVIYRLPAGAFASGVENFSTSGAMTSGVTDLADGFDHFVVAGGDQTSCLFLSRQITLNEYQIRLRVKLGANANAGTLIGFSAQWPAAPYSSYNNGQFSAWLNLQTGQWSSSNFGSVTVQNGFLNSAVAGDIIELTLDVEYLRGKTLAAYKASPFTGEVAQTMRIKNVNADSEGFHYLPGIIMADGDFQLLSYEIISKASAHPEFVVVGDSMGAGVRVSHADSIVGNLEKLTGYKAASVAAGSCFLKGMLATIWQVLAMRPKYALIANYLDPLLSGSANAGNPNHATWTADLARYVSTLQAAGIKPVFMHPEFWPFLANEAQCQVYSDFLDDNYTTIPKIFVTNDVAVFDGTGFHYAGATNKWIASQMVNIVNTQIS